VKRTLLIAGLSLAIICASYAATWAFSSGVNADKSCHNDDECLPNETLDLNAYASRAEKPSSKATATNEVSVSVSNQSYAAGDNAYSNVEVTISGDGVDEDFTWTSTDNNSNFSLTYSDSANVDISVSTVTESSSNSSSGNSQSNNIISNNSSINSNSQSNNIISSGNSIISNNNSQSNSSIGKTSESIVLGPPAAPTKTQSAATIMQGTATTVRPTTTSHQESATDMIMNVMPDSFRPGSQGKLRVIILSSPNFDATTIDPSTLSLAGAPVSSVREQPLDINADGLIDAFFYFEIKNLNLSPNDTQIRISGETFSGQKFKGSASIRVINTSR